MSKKQSRLDFRIVALSLALASSIFLGDLLIPLDVAGGVLYVVAVLATMRHSSRHAATVVAAVSTGFLFLGGLLQEETVYPVIDLLNRVLGLLAIWLTALLVQERKIVEEALRENEQHIRSILHGTADAIVSLDEKGRIRTLNPAAGKIFGYAPDELSGREIIDLITPAFSGEISGYLREARNRTVNGVGREVVGRRRDGATFPMHVLLGEAAGGSFGEITGIFRDVSAQRQLEQEVLAATDEERTRVGYELHEGLGQMLTGIGLITRSLYQKLHSERHPAADEAHQILEFLREADKYAKDLSQGLIPVDGDETGLSYALQRLAAHTSEHFEVACSFRQEAGGAGVEDQAVAAHLYQIVQEAVTMLARYSHARSMQILLSGSAAHARVSIRYDEVEVSARYDEVEVSAADVAAGVTLESSVETDQAALEKWQKILFYRARIIGAILRTRRGQRGGSITCTIPLRVFADEPESS